MIDTLKALLKQKGYSLTKPRRLVFDTLLNSGPKTMSEIVNLIDTKVDRATVYRTVDLFERTGIVNRLNIGFKYKIELSDVFSGHHHHMYCTGCSKTFSLPANSMLETMIDSVAAKSNFSPRGHQLEIYGLCPSCSSSQPS